jgi:hypothetical protein
MVLHESRNSGEISGITGDVVSNILFWLVVIMTSASCLLFFTIARHLEALFSENIINNIRQNRYRHEYEKKIYKRKLEQMSRCKRTLAKFKRLYKQKGENEEVDINYADKKMKEIVEMYKNKQRTTRFKKFISKSLSERLPDDYQPAFENYIRNNMDDQIIVPTKRNTKYTLTSEKIETAEIRNIEIKQLSTLTKYKY